MEWEDCVKTVQSYLEDRPLIVLGSGASVADGLPTMGGLADAIKADGRVKKFKEYGALCKAMDDLGLEAAIDSLNLAESKTARIREIVWNTVNNCELAKHDADPAFAPKSIVKLLRKIIQPAKNNAVIVTTNYDRLPEYAADYIGATSNTGFEGSLLRKLELPSHTAKIKRIQARERVVDIWKVHGSVDWFINSVSRQILSFPFSRSIPVGYEPLIVPPGKAKYGTTHAEPYRTIIAEADKAFMEAGAFLCVGYGFNDEHLQPKLLWQAAMGKPIVILAMKKTNSCKRKIIDAKVKNYMIFEQCETDSTQTTVHYGNGMSDTYDGSFWSLDKFMDIW